MRLPGDTWAELEEALAAGVGDSGVEIGFYTSLFRQPSLNLEVGFGSGRRLLSLLELGYDLRGVESVPSRVERLRHRAFTRGLTPDLEVRELTRLEGLGGGYARVVLTPAALARLHSVDDQLACLSGIHRLLERSGELVIDAGPVDPLRPLRRLGEGRREVLRGDLYVGEQPVVWYREYGYEALTQMLHVTDIVERYDAQGVLVETRRRVCRERVVFRYELEHLLERSGFRVAARYGDFDRSPPGPESPRRLVIARRVER